LFSNTHWSLVLRAQDQSAAALNTLCEKYREPLLVWLRNRQHTFRPLEPEDLVNGFLSAKLEQQFLKDVAPEKGKFRAFVLKCLDHYVKSESRKCKAGVRGGDKPHVAIEETDEQGQPIIEPVSVETGPDQAYDRVWAQTILGNAIYRLEAELTSKGHLPVWEALQPHLYEEKQAPSYARIAQRFGFSEGSLYTAACRIRQRLRELLIEELEETVASPEDFEEERKHFRELFSPPHRPVPGV
jgi:RNA polymerase sigma-70 factor (ECF subfamily)